MRDSRKPVHSIAAWVRSLALTVLLALCIGASPAFVAGEVASAQPTEAPTSPTSLAAPSKSPDPGASQNVPAPESTAAPAIETPAFDLSQVPDYAESPYVEINGNVPTIGAESLPAESESYTPLDERGRCGTAVAVVSPSTMPADGERRGSIGMIKPSGWHTKRYDDLVKGAYLFNRCHLIGWQLTAEASNERNLVTGTRYMNVMGMTPFEKKVADHVKGTGGRVLYRAEPIFSGDELVCRGIHLEGRSLDDDGKDVSFNVFVYNVQPGVVIDYATGDSKRSETPPAKLPEVVAPAEAAPAPAPTPAPAPAPAPAPTPAPAPAPAPQANETTYALNVRTHIFHKLGCSSVERMSNVNKRIVTTTREDVVGQGFKPCKKCHP